jgi:hypothetical protein
MNVVHDRPRAKWLPSRHRFALARLVAFIVLESGGKAGASDVDRIILAIDRDQSAIENYAVAIWFVATTTCFIAALLPLPIPVALLAAFVPALIAVQIPLHFTGPLFRSRGVNAVFTMMCGAAAALYFASQHSWARLPAYAFLGVVALNAAAAVVMWLLRGRVRAAEQRCVA